MKHARILDPPPLFGAARRLNNAAQIDAPAVRQSDMPEFVRAARFAAVIRAYCPAKQSRRSIKT
jgi:hypothetical protein